MTVREIISKIDRLEGLMDNLLAIKDDHPLTTAEGLTIDDAVEYLGDYIEVLGDKQVK